MSKKVKLIGFEKLIELIEEQKPFVSFAKSVADKVDDIDLFDFLWVVEEQVDGITDEDAFCWFVDNYYINEYGEANKRYIDKGYLKVKTDDNIEGYIKTSTVIATEDGPLITTKLME